jgi:nucleoside permease NupC
MFEQYTADGANVFIAIVAVLIGFVAALGYIDFKKVKKDENKES